MIGIKTIKIKYKNSVNNSINTINDIENFTLMHKMIRIMAKNIENIINYKIIVRFTLE